MIGVIKIEVNLKILLNIDMVLIGEEAEADGKVGESSTDLTKALHDCISILSFF